MTNSKFTNPSASTAEFLNQMMNPTVQNPLASTSNGQQVMQPQALFQKAQEKPDELDNTEEDDLLGESDKESDNINDLLNMTTLEETMTDK